ncbi:MULTISPECIES: P-loop NTPase fold protein [unclassified Pseudomonas]|uniref:KAP family P-loop NTPase fold protein n=1 Tax=unclassified Pseudomonas TaxID=196821 RepID=UPI00067E8355|nr:MULTISPECIES: P-loop NTPase fold protein [unclassified Pseudomonas]UVM63281.1 KAP family NTPase [Pseudomonas sp. B21-010]
MVDATEIWADDLMDRQPSAKFLTSYMLANPHVKVLNVNSPWGAGKSFFLNCWKNELDNDYVCVFFNAWETDYTAEPLIALITCIEQQTKDNLDLTLHDAGRTAVNAAASIVKKAAPLIAKGLVKKYIGVELKELLGEEGDQEGADFASDVVSTLIADQAKTLQHVDEFKKAIIERFSQAADNKGLKKPAFIFIDELDRCRPTYAIELLERIKHFFELENCRFIIASDSRQLAHSIRAVYGQGFSSERYLNRFFDAEFNLNNADIYSLVHQSLPKISSVELGLNVMGKVVGNYFPGDSECVYPKKDTVVSYIQGFTENAIIMVGLCKYFKVELRELMNYTRQIKSACDSIQGSVHFFWLAYLVFFKASKSEFYSDLWVSGKSRQAIAAYDEKEADPVTFSFTTELATVSHLATYYLALLESDHQSRSSMAQSVSSWRSPVYFALSRESEILKLQSYKDVVELAHRLS